MTSTDETQGEDVYGVDSADSSHEDEFAPPRRRRSTYTPPPQYRAAMDEPTPAVPAPAIPAPIAEPPVWQAPVGDSTVDTPIVATPVWAAPAAEAPVWSPPAAEPYVWTAPVDEPVHEPVVEPLVKDAHEPAPVSADIPDWDAQQSPEPDAHNDQPRELPVEPTSPYRPWTPDSHVDADAYWNTVQSTSAKQSTPEPVQPIEYVPFANEPIAAAPAPTVEPLPSAPVWSLDTDDAPQPDRYRPWVPEPSETTPLWEALFPTSPPVAYGTHSAPEPAVAPDPVGESEPQVVAEPVREDTAPPLYMTPDDEAATLAAHAPPAGQPWIPQRRSLPDDVLLSVLEAADKLPGGTLDAMDALENEMRLREEEVQEYREWEDSMLAVGTPEALAVVAQVRPEFTAIVIPAELEPTPTTAIPIQYPSAPEAATPAAAPVESETPVKPETPVEPEAPHDMPQSWFDALAAHTDNPAPVDTAVDATVDASPAFVARPTGYPVPAFDDLVNHEPTVEPESENETVAPVAPEEKKKRPFGVAVDDGQPQLVEPPVSRPSVFRLELAGVAPTPRDLRTGRASRLFWLWFAANASVLSLGMGATIFTLGMSLRQSVIAVVAGVALSFIPLGIATLAGKRSGQPTIIVSRAAFGVSGNVLAAVLAFGSRVFWGSVLLWLLATSVSTLIGGEGGSTAGLTVVFIVVGVMLAVVVAFLGYRLLARVQLVVTVLSAVLIAGFVALTWSHVDLPTAITVDDGPWVLVITGAVLVFAFLGLVWANSASDLARYQRPGSSGASNLLWASFGSTLPSLLLISYGALLAASDATLAARIVADPVSAISSILPEWYPVPLVIATALGLLSGVILSTYSGAFALQAIGLRVERQWGTLIVGALLAVIAVGFSLLDIDLADVFRDLATTIAVPVAAWTGIFAADTMIRNRRLHSASLLRRGGIYPNVNWVNLSALVAITALGWGLTTATVAALDWQGYLFPIAGVDVGGTTAASDIGVLVALVLGLLTPLVSGIPTIRRQEAAPRPN